MFDLRMDFVGDFTLQPTRVNLEGTYAKKKFIAQYYQGRQAPRGSSLPANAKGS